MTQKQDHLTLSKAGTFSLGPAWRCLKCKKELWTEVSMRTNGQEWWFTRDGKRHYKKRCNLEAKE